MSSDVLTKRVTGTGSLAVGPARVRQIQVLTGAGAGRLTVTNGNGGTTVLDIDFLASDSHSINIPDDGIIATSGAYVSAFTGSSNELTIFLS